MPGTYGTEAPAFADRAQQMTRPVWKVHWHHEESSPAFFFAADLV